MKLLELFNSDVSYKVITDNDRSFVTSSMINDREIQVVFHRIDLRTSRWYLEFAEKWAEDRPGKTHLTGNGGAFAVFSLIKKLLPIFVEKHKPNTIEFSSSNNDGNRTKAYVAMLSKFKLPGYKISSYGALSTTSFTFTREVKDE